MSHESPTSLGIRPRADSRRGARQSLTQHQSFQVPAYPGWVSYASQLHVRDIALDGQRGCMWMATWGGVLCWMPGENLCKRYTSAHGLIGNATRSLTVDESGNVWAGGQAGGLCRLHPGDGLPWQPLEELQSWIVLHLAPRPDGGIYAALRQADGKCALGEIAPPGYQLWTRQGGLATKEIQTLLVDEDRTLWAGNMWGLHRQRDDGSFVTVKDLPFPVRALADIGPVLWVGTDRGVYSLRSGQEKAHREPDWPHGQVTSLTVEPATGNKWLVTGQGVGRIVDNVWQPLPHFPAGRLQLNELLASRHEPRRAVPPPQAFLGVHQTWAAGAGDLERGMAGLYRIGIDEYEAAFGLDPEDTLSNAVQCLWIDETMVWVGTARGLCCFDGRTWRNYVNDDPGLRDVRAILPGQTPEWLWVGSGQSGFHRLCSGVHLPDVPSTWSVVAMAAGGDGTLWAATPEEVLCQAPQAAKWEPTVKPAGAPAIQTLGATNEALWVGTAEGLWRYRPYLKLWYPPADGDTLRHLSIQALAVDPSNSKLWVGTDSGLYSWSGDNWVCYREAKVSAMAFAPEGTFWLGTATGLEQWPAPGDGSVLKGQPLARFSAVNSGLAADLVTALAVRAVGNTRQVWIGSPAGVSCYQYTL